MTKDYIDVDYTEVEEQSTQKGDITINADPLSAAISGIGSVVDNITSAVKEYNMCRQQEQTRRAEITANMKVAVAQIDAQKEVILKHLNYDHEMNLEQIRNHHERAMKQLDMVINTVNSAVEEARKNRDFSAVIALLEISNQLTKTQNEFTLQLMGKRTSTGCDHMLAETLPKGYLT